MSPILDSIGSTKGYGWGSFTSSLAGDFESIASFIVGSGGSSSISFISIPSTYTHLQLRWMARTNRTGSADGDYMEMQFNSDSTSSYYGQHWIGGNGSALLSSADGSATMMYVERLSSADQLSNAFGIGVTDILEYKNTNKYKTVRTFAGFENNGLNTYNIRFGSNLWMKTNEINRIDLAPGVGSLFVQNSTFALYGVKG